MVKIVGTALIAASVLLAASLFNGVPMRGLFSHQTQTQTVLTIETLTPTASPTRTPTTVPSPTPTPREPTPGPEMLRLQEQLEEAIVNAGTEGLFATCVTDLQTNETVCVNGDELIYPGCTMNYFILLQSTLDLQNGMGDEAVIGDLMSRTIYGSNPVTACALYGIAGGGDCTPEQLNVRVGVNRTWDLIVRILGKETRFVLDHPPVYSIDEFPLYRRGVDENNWITPREFNTALLVTWEDRSLLFDQWLGYLLEKMEGVKPGLNYLLGSTPGGVISHKNGFFAADDGWVDNDVGIVRFESGGKTYAYAITFFSERVPVKYADIPVGQRIARLAWDYFLVKY